MLYLYFLIGFLEDLSDARRPESGNQPEAIRCRLASSVGYRCVHALAYDVSLERSGIA